MNDRLKKVMEGLFPKSDATDCCGGRSLIDTFSGLNRDGFAAAVKHLNAHPEDLDFIRKEVAPVVEYYADKNGLHWTDNGNQARALLKRIKEKI